MVGAGPSGLATAKALADRGIDFDWFEKGSMVGEPGGSSIGVESDDVAGEHVRLTAIGGVDLDPELMRTAGAPMVFMRRDPMAIRSSWWRPRRLTEDPVRLKPRSPDRWRLAWAFADVQKAGSIAAWS